jgi:hypothetical protein
MAVYFHSQPPLIGIDMSIVTFRLLEIGGLLYFPLTYWMLSNPLIFGNKVSSINYQSEVIRTGHQVLSPELGKYGLDPATVVLVAWLLILALWFMRKTYLVSSYLI